MNLWDKILTYFWNKPKVNNTITLTILQEQVRYSCNGSYITWYKKNTVYDGSIEKYKNIRKMSLEAFVNLVLNILDEIVHTLDK